MLLEIAPGLPAEWLPGMFNVFRTGEAVQVRRPGGQPAD
jgi:hypothetical protein